MERCAYDCDVDSPLTEPARAPHLTGMTDFPPCDQVPPGYLGCCSIPNVSSIQIVCTAGVNGADPRQIPTLSVGGMLLFVALVTVAAVGYLKRFPGGPG